MRPSKGRDMREKIGWRIQPGLSSLGDCNAELFRIPINYDGCEQIGVCSGWGQNDTSHVVAGALANKNARIVWSLLSTDQERALTLITTSTQSRHSNRPNTRLNNSS